MSHQVLDSEDVIRHAQEFTQQVLESSQVKEAGGVAIWESAKQALWLPFTYGKSDHPEDSIKTQASDGGEAGVEVKDTKIHIQNVDKNEETAKSCPRNIPTQDHLNKNTSMLSNQSLDDENVSTANQQKSEEKLEDISASET